MKGIIFGCAVPHPPIIIPAIGRGEERKIQATTDSLNRLGHDLAQLTPDMLVIVSPHGNTQYEAMGVASSSYSEGNFNVWGVPGIDYRFKNDLNFVGYLQEECKRFKVPLNIFQNERYELDWGVLVPIYFLTKEMKNISLVPLTFSFLSLDTHYAFGKAIRKAAEHTEKKVAFVASGDLSHRLIPGAPAGYDPMGKVFDNKMVEAMSNMDSQALLKIDPDLIDRAGECGLRSLTILLGLLEGLAVKPEVLSYEGPFGVGYMVASFIVKQHPEEE